MRSSLLLAIAAVVGLPLHSAAPAQAQPFNRTWVSGLGDDANPCTRDLPCRTFGTALPRTLPNGEINCVDASDFTDAGFGINIQKSITIDCHDFAGLGPVSGATAIVINVPGNANDPLRTVRLRGLRITGAGFNAGVGTRIGRTGIRIFSALHVFIEDVLVAQMINTGILDDRSGGGNLYIRNTIVRDNAGTGIVVLPQGGSIDAVIDNSHVNRNNFGLAAGLNSRVLVNGSVFMGNAVRGVHADNGGKLAIDRSVINGNVIGVGADAGSTVALANTDIMFNGTGISGNTSSFTNNRIFANGVAGTPPTPIGAATHDTGQQ
jgi:hypothetical protein